MTFYDVSIAYPIFFNICLTILLIIVLINLKK
jgi:hypothetical protein